MKLVQKAIDVSRGKKSRKAGEKPEATPLMPDEEELQRARRRKAAKRRGGRASTILTGDGDRLGP